MAVVDVVERCMPSLPVRGAWVEISLQNSAYCAIMASLPVRGAWVEMLGVISLLALPESLPVRGAWVEMRRAMICVMLM